MHRHRLVLALILLMFASAAFAAGPTTLQSRIAIAEKLWNDELAKAEGKPKVHNQYPTEAALPFLSAYVITHDEKFSAQANVQLDYAHSREKDALLITFEGVVHRDYQARQIYNNYLAYRVLKDDRYLQWADAEAAAMIKTIPRLPHTFNNELHTLFAATFIKPNGEPVDPLMFTIDVNQNAEVGYAFSLLFHDAKSQFFQKPIARDIAYEETLASMSLQVMETGEIPLRENEWIRGYDTAYGGYATFSWTGTQQLWHEPKFEPHLRAAAKWLAPMNDLDHDSQRWYPKRIENGKMQFWETWFRVPLLWYSGADAQKLIDGMFARMEHPEQFKDDPGIVPGWFAHFELMGVPRDYYIAGNPHASRNEKSP